MAGGLFDQRWSHVKRISKVLEATNELQEEKIKKMEQKSKVKDLHGR